MTAFDRKIFLKKIACSYDPEVFDTSDGLPSEELNRKIRALYIANEQKKVPFAITRARMIECFLQNVRIAITEHDPFASVLERQTLSVSPKNEIITIQQERKVFYAKTALGDEAVGSDAKKRGLYRCRLDLSHTVPDWDNILQFGVPGLLTRATQCWQKNPSPFAESVLIVYNAFRDFLLRYAAFAEKHQRRDLSTTLLFLADNAPETLQQALQLGLLYREIQEIEGEWVRSMGIFDRMYYAFYANDLSAGRLTEQSAADLLFAYFGRFIVQSQGRDNGTPYCLGGLLPAGGDGSNVLSRLTWQVFRELGQVDPKFSLRVNSETPADILNLAADCIKEGKTSIVFANEVIAGKMFLKHGKTVGDLANFVPVGCYEPTIMGKELACTMTVLFNFAGLFEELFAQSNFSPESFEEVLAEYLRLQKKYLADCMEKVNALEKYWQDVNPSPLLSGTMDECMERGLDVSQYGCKYSTSGVMCAGIGTAVDSLIAIRQMVFEQKLVTFSELGKILSANWQGFEELRLLAAHRLPKWGVGDQDADTLAEIITHCAGEQIMHTANVKGGTFQMGLWSIDWSFIFGRETAATPDGRLAGTPISRNSGSSVACDSEGVAGLIESAAKLDHTYFADGAVLDVMLSPQAVSGENGSELIVRLIKTFFARGGLFIQFNVLSPDLLRAAQKDPQQYQNLQIRLCGWNVRFIDLPPHIQQTFIEEAENGVKNC